MVQELNQSDLDHPVRFVLHFPGHGDVAVWARTSAEAERIAPALIDAALEADEVPLGPEPIADDDSTTTITITRAKLYPQRGQPSRFAWKWSYDYRVDDGPTCQYGPGLADLRAMLREHFPGANIVEAWGAEEPPHGDLRDGEGNLDPDAEGILDARQAEAEATDEADPAGVVWAGRKFGELNRVEQAKVIAWATGQLEREPREKGPAILKVLDEFEAEAADEELPTGSYGGSR